jgi:hypothetical protein
MHASRVARDRARRLGFDAETGELRGSGHGQLVADRVELFAPVVFEAHRPSAWPVEGSLLLDHLPFRVRALDADGRRIPAGRVAFDVFCAVGYCAGKPRLWRAEAFSTAHPANWGAFLGSLAGELGRIVCETHRGMLRAIAARRPAAELRQCEWHPRHALERPLAKEARSNPGEGLEALRARAEGALAGPSFWRPFVRAARALRNESLDRWIAVNGPTIDSRFARRGPASRRPADVPLTTAALERIARPIVAALHPRRHAPKNRERLNRLLMLPQLHANGDDDAQAHPRAIRAWLQSNGGRPLAPRRAIADPAASPSLR